MPPFNPDPENEVFEDIPLDEADPSLPTEWRESRVLAVSRFLWNPAPLPPPVIDPDLEQLSWPERVAELSRYGLLGAEYWLSQGGTLREWLRLNLWAAIVLTVAAVLLVPPVTAVLKGAAEWTALLGEILENVSAAIMGLPPLVIGLATLLLLLRIGQRYWQRRKRGRSYRDDAFDGYQ